MATITLTAGTDYSALTIANDDTIDCAGFVLTLDVAPTETGVQVTSPGTDGRVVFDGGWNLSTWDFFAGESTLSGMIGTLPSGATIKSITGGTILNARGIGTNDGTITSVTSGSGTHSHGCLTNNGTITTATGGSAPARAVFINAANGIITNLNGGPTAGGTGCNTNNGTITTATGDKMVACEHNHGTIGTAIGGSANIANGCNTNNLNGTIGTATGGSASAHGCNANNGTITTATGGSANNANGCNTNSGTITTVIGGSVNGAFGCGSQFGTVVSAVGGTSATAHGVNSGGGLTLRITDNTGRGLAIQRGSVMFVEGPHINGIIPDNIKTIYSLGTLSGSATIAGDAVVTTLSEGGGASRPVNPFTQQVIG